MSIITLNEVPDGSKGIIKKVIATGDIKRRLLDIGLTPGTKIDCLYRNIGGNLVTYDIKGAFIAIRKEDSANIFVEVVDE